MTASLLTLTQPNSPAAEAFRTLRSNLIFASLEKPLQTLLVTSAAADEGKSAALANLAVVMAQGGRRTILVDCDLRKPRQHTLFGAPNLTGFSDWMVEPDPAPPALTELQSVMPPATIQIVAPSRSAILVAPVRLATMKACPE